MGRVIIPLSILNEQRISGWYPLGRAAPKDQITGEIYLELSLVAQQPIPRWSVDSELLTLCKKRSGFELPFMSGDTIMDFPGKTTIVIILFNNLYQAIYV